MMHFPEKLSLAQLPTPLQPLDRLSEALGGPRIWIKRDDMTGAVSTGNKVRKLEFILAEALADGCDTLITCGGIQSNHCRATAVLGAQLGMKVHLILRGQRDNKPLNGNLLLDYLVGAEVSCYPETEYRELAGLFNTWKKHYQEMGRNPLCIPTGGSGSAGVWGYLGCAIELIEDFKQHNISPAAIVHATGSGGTQAGLTLGMEVFGLPQVTGVAVCDNEVYFQNKVKRDLEVWQQRYQSIPSVAEVNLSHLSIRTNDDHIGSGYGIATEAVFSTIRHVAKMEGMVLDPVYSGKAFHGMVEEVRKGTFTGAKDIVFVHTGGIFGLLAQQEQLGLDK